jgi:hypothetical protein
MIFQIVKTQVETTTGRIKTAWNVVALDGYVFDTFDRKRDALHWVALSHMLITNPTDES